MSRLCATSTPGAVRAILAYNTRYECRSDFDDPIVAQWVRSDHKLAQLIEHADRQYDIRFNLSFSRRPWATPVPDGGPITGIPGFLWHARFFMISRSVRPGRLWDDADLAAPRTRDRLIFLCLNGFTVDFAFPALADTAVLVDDIGRRFTAILDVSRPARDHDNAERALGGPSLSLDPRIQVRTPWAFLGEDTMPISLFCG